MWDLSSGKYVFEFSTDKGDGGGIRAMDIDHSGKRYRAEWIISI